MDTLIDNNNIPIEKLNFLNFDIQGVDLRALKSMEKYLKHVNYIYTEVNADYVYKDCNLIGELDEYLKKFGFERIATGTMGFPPKHPLVRHAIDHIKANEVSNKATQQRAWKTVGPLLLTKLYFTGKYNDLTIFPSYYFLPIHCTGKEYKGHGKIYAYQEWGSTKRNYEIMNSKSLPSQFLKPEDVFLFLYQFKY